MSSSNYQKGQFLVVPNKDIALKLRGAALNVYLAVIDHSDDAGQCFPSFKRLAEVTGFNARQCQRAVYKLEEIGLLKKKGRAREDGSQTSNSYQLQVIHTGHVLDVVPPHDTDVVPGGDTDVVPKLYPSNSTQFNSRRGVVDKKAYAKACEQDRALARREARREPASKQRGTTTSVGELLHGKL